jgi:hypothetical protein
MTALARALPPPRSCLEEARQTGASKQEAKLSGFAEVDQKAGLD